MYRCAPEGRLKLFICLFFTVCCLLLTPGAAGAGPLDEWQAMGSGTTSDLYNVTYGGGRFVAVGASGSILTSSDGSSWSFAGSPTTALLYGVIYGSGVFVASGQAGTVLSSSNGTSWTQRTSGITNQLYCAAYGGGRFVVVGTSGAILTSSDGSSWTKPDSGVSLGLFGVTYGNGRFVIVGESGVVLTSSDGADWSRQTSNTSRWLDEVAYGNGRFVAAGEGGAVITSPDGLSWTPYSAGTAGDLYCIGFGNGTFAAVGAGGAISTTSDGASWTVRSSGTTANLRGIAFDGRRFLATGFQGTILQSGAVSGPPVANAGMNRYVTVGTLVTLDGTASYDPLGGSLTYEWRIDSRPANSTTVLSAPASVNPSFTPDVVGRYTVRLVVRNGDGEASDPSWMTVSAGTPPIAEPGADQSGIAVGSQVTLDGSGSSAPDGNLPLSFSWEIAARPSNSTATLTGASSAQARFIPDARGIYTIRLTVTNSIGLSSVPRTTTVSVGHQPVADAGGNRTVNMGTRVTLDASRSWSPDAAMPLTFAWEFRSRPGGSSASLQDSTTAQTSFMADKPGDFMVAVTVVDPAGFESQPSTATVSSQDPNGGGSGGGGGGGGGGGCFIATAAFGSYLAPEVVVLRQFRDNVLLRSHAGRLFVRGYNACSPRLARRIEHSPVSAFIVRATLTPVIWALKYPAAFICALLLFCGLLMRRYYLRIRKGCL